jgi:diguanylate cyclase (GGDEF)-like protein
MQKKLFLVRGRQRAMKLVSFDKKSIIFKLTFFVIIIIIFQALLLVASIVAGGVLSQGRDNAYSSLNGKVSNRKDYLQREMNNRWTNTDPYLSFISKAISVNEDKESFFKESVKYLIPMLRTTQTTGVFVILNDENSNGEHSAVYIRDYDPLFNGYDNKDLYLLFGYPELAKEVNIPLDEEWNYKIKLTDDNKDFYMKPYENAHLANESSLLSYWSMVFKLYPEDKEIITYSMPLFDSQNKVRGVIGVEVSLNYFTQALPSTDLQPRDSFGYTIGYRASSTEEIRPLFINSALQKRIFTSKGAVSLEKVDSDKSIYKIGNKNGFDRIYACVEEIVLYKNNTPFKGEQWYLIGMMTDNYLFSYVHKIQNILWISLSFSIIISIIAAYLFGFHFTKPIVSLAKQVRERNKNQVIELESTGLSEVDELSLAIQTASNELLESSSKMSQIIDMVEISIGAFEYSEDSEGVFVTDRLQHILCLDEEEMQSIIKRKSLFMDKINKILNTPEKDEEGVYIVNKNPEKYVKIKMVKNTSNTIGVIIDVTEEIEGKNKIKEERDYDPLTRIYNRKAVQKHIEEKIKNIEKLKTTAILMFDLDNLKLINDTYGHKWGDIYIRAAVEKLNSIGNEDKILGRRSGDEFVLLLYGYSDKNELKAAIDEFYQKLRNEPLILEDGKSMAISISAGLLWIEDAKFSYEEMLQYSDEALYKAKNSHKGTCYEVI